jgi:hypothetical protein
MTVDVVSLLNAIGTRLVLVSGEALVVVGLVAVLSHMVPALTPSWRALMW